MKEVVELNVTSFRGSLNGEHYYGTLRVRTKGELFDADDVLVMDKDAWCSGVYIALAGPSEVVEYLNAHPDYAEQQKFLMANGYLLLPQAHEVQQG